MPNKKIVKLLGILISSSIVLGSSGQILAKKESIKQEGVQQINAEVFRNFKKENYEKEGFELEIFYKDNAPILLYKHIKTGAKVIIIPTDISKEKTFFSIPNISFNFNIYDQNNRKEMDRFIRSAIISNFKMEDLKNEEIKKLDSFSVTSFSPNLEINFGHHDKNLNKTELEHFLKKLFSFLKNPKIFRDDETFKLEKKRVLNYLKNFLKEPDRFSSQTSSINIEKVEKVTKNDLLNFYESRVNPSNLLVTKHADLNNYEEILNFLEFLNKEYFNYYDYKKPNFPTYGTKVNSIYNVNAASFESAKFEGKDYNFHASLDFSVNPYGCENEAFIKKHPFLLYFDFTEELLEKIKFKEYIKELGYLNGNFIFSALNLYANDKSLFEKGKLKENGKKIFNYVLEKIKNIPRKEIEEKYFRNYNEKNTEDFYPNNPIVYNATRNSLKNVLVENFLNFNKPFSEKFLKINKNNNEIEDSNETLKSKFMEDFENIGDIEKEFNEDPYCNINVYSKEKKEEEKHLHKLLVPLEIKSTKNNSTLKYLAKYFLTTNFLDIKNYEYALPEDLAPPVKFLEDYIGAYCTANEELSNDTLNFYYKDFENLIKNYNITKEYFEKTKENFMNFEINKNFVSSFDSGIETIENFLKNGYEEKLKDVNPGHLVKITKETPRYELFRHYKFLLEDCLFENFNEYVNYTKILSEFIKRNNIKSNEKVVTVTKEFAQDLLENVIKPLKKIIERTENLKKEFKENLNKISYEEFVEYVKSAKSVEKEKLEKDQKKIRELEEMSSYAVFF